MSQLINQIFEIETLTLNAHYRNRFVQAATQSDSMVAIDEQLFDDIKRALIDSVVTQVSINTVQGFDLQPPQLIICQHGLSGLEKKQLWQKLSDIQK
ncbi:hypothetical protein [Pseudoalteromonas tunicata]|jgi:hypothetical protein|uniref:Uncharacterized protein n=1 Tax=Pseudoalteromonas tunicata D2 TaxID=87626 RepID=A4C6X9_9GAMM|nr:hypothetical protein [Pseudoalteromonas tunicata]ATC95703.1 hypothetical protein PTUN_a3359 [Pseudoalteromonas tunicata]AXT31260.1 hypothetical protein D1819_10870 [Pseudoalteromonas tunicata]EAR29733.1 hypothetical protein PTD2_12974 [Pseudoalteromonas tunicata D2]MDP4985064.1 hypothetical protein [Pseudoalteromonas tunicata]